MAVTAQFMPTKKTLNDQTWAEIRQVSDTGKGAEYWKVGDCKGITINGTVGTLAVNTTLYAYILGFNHNSAKEGAGIQFGTFKSALNNGVDVCLIDGSYSGYKTDGTKLFNMNHWGNYNYGGWIASDLRYDTFVLDFVNAQEDILAAFQPFYQETTLQEEVNVDLIYQTQKELRGFGIYSDTDIEAFAKEYFKANKQDSKSMGRMSSVLKPVADRYNQKTTDERYQFRRQARSLVKWYSYISQITRMFDKELHKEFVFCSYLLKLLPAEAVDMIDLEGKLKLEYYKLQKTFEGTITLQEEKGVYEAAKQKGATGQDPKEPLDEIIEKINEKYKGAFTEGDRVLLNALHTKLMANKKLASMAKTSDPQIFAESIFPKAFGDAAQDSYMEAQDTYTALFEDQSKYNAIMRALAEVIYREMRTL